MTPLYIGGVFYLGCKLLAIDFWQEYKPIANS